MMLQWYPKEKREFEDAPLVRVLPPTVDFVLLDGGEFSTRGDWEYPRTLSPRVVALDDVWSFKCRGIAAELMSSPKKWRLLREHAERNGWAVFERVENLLHGENLVSR
jgi:hypothetical protein